MCFRRWHRKNSWDCQWLASWLPGNTFSHLGSSWEWAARGEIKAGSHHCSLMKDIIQEAKSKGTHWPSCPEPGSMRLPGIPNNMVQKAGSPWKSVCITPTSWEKENLETVYSSKAWKGEGEGDYSIQRKTHKTTLVNCLPPVTYAKWTNRVWSKIRIWAYRPPSIPTFG